MTKRSVVDPADAKLAELQSGEQRFRNAQEQAEAREAEERRAAHAINRHARRVARAFARKVEVEWLWRRF